MVVFGQRRVRFAGGSAERGWWWLLAAGVAVIFGFYALPRAGVAQAVVASCMNALAAVAPLVAATRADRRSRPVWVALALGGTFSTLASCYTYFYPHVTGHSVPFPSPSDALWLSMYPCYAAALWVLARRRRGEDHRGDLLDAVIIVAGVGALIWTFVLGPAVHTSGLAPLAHAVSVAYPVADLMVFAMLVRLLVGERRNGAMWLLVAAFVMLMVSDTVLAFKTAAGTFELGGVTDGTFTLSYVLVAAAAFHPAGRSFSRTASTATHRLSVARMVFLGAALLVGPILLATGPRDVVLIASLSVLTFVTVMARMARLNRRLAAAWRSVEDKTGQLRHQALHDALTGLPNRALIMDRLDQLLARNRRHGTTGAAMFVDLDGFKGVNDTLGHEVGDRLLQSVAVRLTGSLRDADTIGRMGGDEFVILLDGATLLTAPELVAERIVDVMRQPFDVERTNSPIMITTSVGIAAGPRDNPGDLLRDADMALYQAKAAGRNCYEVFRPEMQGAVQRRYQLELDLRSALRDNQFRLVYQPIYGLDELDLAGFEALLRWDHPSLGLVQPLEFIPLLEATGQIVDVGHWVLREACSQMVAWQASGRSLVISVNVSARQLDRDIVIDHVREALEVSGLAPSALTLEITETTLMRNVDAATRRLHQLKALGVRIAIDDFGTGYSSLAYLQHFPVDCLKIDRAFTEAISSSPGSDALIHTLVQLGKDLGLKTLAEGVETTNQIDHLRAEHVNEVQGFLLAKPLSAEAVESQLLSLPVG